MVRKSYSSHYWCFFYLVRKSKTSCVSWKNDFDDNKPGNSCYHHYHDDDQASIVRFVGPHQIVCPTSSNQTSQLFLQGFFFVGTRQTGLSQHVYSCPDNFEQMLFEAARRGLDPVSGKKNDLLPTAIQLSLNEMNKH